MVRRKNRVPDGPRIFEEQERQLVRRLRRQRALFIPRLWVRRPAPNAEPAKGCALCNTLASTFLAR
jgi:hypothetical protein